MITNALIRKYLTLGVIVSFFVTGILPSLSENISSGEQTSGSMPDNGVLDVPYIYNITKALSNIVFTEYDEENGEIARGRAFGTVGEHKAAEILYENMTKLGLYTTKEKLKTRYPGDWIISQVDVLDYKLKINNETNSLIVDCAPQITKVDSKTVGKLSRLQLNYNFSGLKIRREHPSSKNDEEDYVLLEKRSVQNFTFSGKTLIDMIKEKINSSRPLKRLLDRISQRQYPHYKGRIIYYPDNKDTHDMNYFGINGLPTFFINGTIGAMIDADIEEYTADFYLEQRLNRSVESYNVIGQLNGTDPSKTVIIDCLYDSWWCQGTGDSAIGMAMVLGIAKYFRDHNITPKYTIKFIAFGGEESGCRGSIYYVSTHLTEKIIYVIDLNQLGFKQIEPKLRLEVVGNNRKSLNEIWKIVSQTDYINRTENVTGVFKIFSIIGHNSDDRIFTMWSLLMPFRNCKTVCFLKNGQWLYHHRDGLNHTEGDVLDYFDWNDVNVTGEIILNVTKYITVGCIG